MNYYTGHNQTALSIEDGHRRDDFRRIDSHDHDVINVLGLARTTIALIRKYWLWVALSFFACCAIGVAITLLATPLYQAKGVVQIEPDESRIVAVDDVVQNQGGGESLAFYKTQYGLLSSQNLAERVVDKLGVKAFIGPKLSEQNPASGDAQSSDALRRRAISGVMQSLTIAPVTGSRLVAIKYNNTDPTLAKNVVDTYIDQFIASNLERRFEASSYARTFLETRISDLRQKLENTERELVAYAGQENLVGQIATGTEGERKSASDVALETLAEALATATQRRIETDQKWSAMQGSGAEMTKVLENASLQSLNVARTGIVAEYQDKLAVFGPEYPSVRQLRARMGEYDRQIQSETAKIRASYTQDARADARSAAGVETALRGEIARLREEALSIDQRAIRYNILKRDLDTNKTLYDGLLQRYREIGVAGGIGVNNVAIVDRAIVPTRPISPRPIVNMALALLAGAVLSGIVVLILENWTQAFRRPDQMAETLGINALGCIPFFAVSEAGLLAELENPRAPITEAYHSARAALQFARPEGLPKSLFVTSTRSGEGKSTSSVCLAIVFARVGMKVLIVDADLRDPSLHKMFGCRNKAGLSSLIHGEVDLDACLTPTAEPNLTLMTAGPLPMNASELISGQGCREAIEQLEAAFDIVILDGPPIMGLADAPIFATMVESVLFVTAANGVSRVAAKRALDRLPPARTQVLGAVLTKFDTKAESYGGYGYNESYGAYAYAYGASVPHQEASPQSASAQARSI